MIGGLKEKKNLQKTEIKKSKVKVYLAGSIDQKEYRTTAKEYSKGISKKIETINPFDYDFQKDGHIAIVENDKKLIQKSDILVAYIEYWTCGTIMETIYAWEIGKPVYVISPKNTPYRTCNWIKYHTTQFFDTIEDCFDFIKGIHVK